MNIRKKQQNFITFFFLISLILGFGCTLHKVKEPASSVSGSHYLENVPPQPGEDSWHFIKDLKAPIWTKHAWKKTVAGPQQADLSKGITIKRNFPDTKGRLETAYEDLRCFSAAGGIPVDKGGYVIETAESPDLKGESFHLEVKPNTCRILAGDVEGIRRGIFHIEDEMLRIRGPYLSLGTIQKHPVVQRRISRCVYGPIKRPPAMRDELMDDVDYYPDQYLNRLAHEGVNGLWLTVEFRDLVSTKFTPDAAKDAVKRLAKLRRTAVQCRRYGIRTYIFAIEPRAWGSWGSNGTQFTNEMKVLENYPELGGGKRGKTQFFCPFSETAQQYLYQVVNTIFKEVPDLGGIINISHGERDTTCLGAVPSISQFKGKIDCPRCSKKEPWEILYASLSVMERGMHDAVPDAELISWLYMPQSEERGDWVYELSAHTPKGVILQCNFESGVTRTIFGKNLVGGDYWLSTPGPSKIFERQAKIARENGTQVSAKLQTGNSHEVASIPYVPVPSMVYRKFSAMHRLGVSHAMLGWYFGNYPGLMIRSAGELSFDPLPENEDAFLRRLASVYWKEGDVSKVVEAWKDFAEGYGNYPLQGMLGYYGPMHDGPVWPLFLKPVDAPLSPTWQLGSSITLKPWPPSGDRIGECLSSVPYWGYEPIENILTLEETVELCRRMSTTWDKGVAILNQLESRYKNEPERVLDIGVAKALGIQFRSGYNILHFYFLREKMLRMEGMERLDVLKQLENIMREELAMDKQLLDLCGKDSRLGFHSEAEGYKYFPEKIRWRMQQLKDVLANDLPEMKKSIRDNKLLCPEYTGKEPAGLVAYAMRSTGSLWSGSGFDISPGLQWQPCSYNADKSMMRWAAACDTDAMYIIASDSADSNQSADVSPVAGITVRLEPRRLWPSVRYVFSPGGENPVNCEVRVVKESGKWYAVARVPFKNFWWRDEKIHPVRLDVRIQRRGGRASNWCPSNPITSRLALGSDNPADLGWLIFK